ncbi:response regulator transcription factor [Allosphingosinicella flava]|uniref:Response regulator transcription factor n=1 Tax=Allosphingosinicella flava TaxID=2771430 RepID=A0A7T2GKA9_9SPHN|nr:response regulator transcription factor [Sphingosinicella flava]QPQ55083.1 response regulator transcription factor [Sphingosinicella flava]
MIRVVIVDDQTLVRQGIQQLLALVPDVEVIGLAEDGETALGLIRKAAPDVVLLDIRMPGLDGIGVLETLKRWNCLPPTLILTTFDDGEAALAAIRAGAKGYMMKDVSLDDLAGAIRALANGGTAFHPALSHRLLANAAQSEGGQQSSFSLTGREREVLRLMMGGYSNREIAEALDLAEGTIKNHVSNILIKLDARDRTRAVLKAIEGNVLR